MEVQADNSKKLTTKTNIEETSAKKSISLIYNNVQSLNSKIEEVRLIASSIKPKIMAFVETWLDNSHQNSEIDIVNYRLLRRDRKPDANRGGVCIYIDESFRANNVWYRPAHDYRSHL